MKIIDTTTYFEEEMMMNLRFNILDKYVDHFIVSESRFTHSGNEKGIKFDKRKFPQFAEKITHIVLEKEPNGIIKRDNLSTKDLRLNSIIRIKAQRDLILKYIKSYAPDDYIIHSDNDEIPDLKNFDFDKNNKKFVIFNQRMFYYKFNLSLPGLNWFGSKACKIKYLKSIDILRSIKNKVYPYYRIDTLFSDLKHQSLYIVKNGGWHFSNLKNLEELERKYLNDENHAEYEEQGFDKNRIIENLKNKTIDYDHYAKKGSSNRFNSNKLEKIDMNILPKFILNNLDTYKEWIDYS
tara:strand:- start:302 stop:1183 length:882 start_codon:yes stop_codon:yes gene_type:complete